MPLKIRVWYQLTQVQVSSLVAPWTLAFAHSEIRSSSAWQRLVRVECHVPRHHPITSGQSHLSEVFVLVTPEFYQVLLAFLDSRDVLQSSSQLSSIITILIMVKIRAFYLQSSTVYAFLFTWLTTQLTSTVVHICRVAELLKLLWAGWFISPMCHLPVPFSRNS